MIYKLLIVAILTAALIIPSSVFATRIGGSDASRLAPQTPTATVTAETAEANENEPEKIVSLIGISDIGCKSDSQKNLENIAKTGISVISAGDIRYKCDIPLLNSFWKNIQTKHGTYGNHDVESSSSKQFVKDLFGLGASGWFTWREAGWNVGIIGMNQYTDYSPSSIQYKYVKAALERYQANDKIDFILVVFHEPIRTPGFDGGHGPADKFKNIYEPLFQKYDKVIVLEAHNHGVWWGENNKVNQIGCGGGGYGGDDFNGEINGFSYATDKMGYCLLDFFPGKLDVKHIATDGKTVLEQTEFTN